MPARSRGSHVNLPAGVTHFGLWIAAVDKTKGTVDPSHPAFYVDGQTDKPNMRGFWALSACTATPAAGDTTSGACTAGFECCSGFCVDGRCADPGSIK